MSNVSVFLFSWQAEHAFFAFQGESFEQEFTYKSEQFFAFESSRAPGTVWGYWSRLISTIAPDFKDSSAISECSMYKFDAKSEFVQFWKRERNEIRNGNRTGSC